jgi:hypothetical protein
LEIHSRVSLHLELDASSPTHHFQGRKTGLLLQASKGINAMGKDAGKDEGRSYLEGKLDHDGVEEATELLWRNKRTTNVGAKSVGRIEDDRSIETSNGVIKRHLELVAVCMPLTRQR